VSKKRSAEDAFGEESMTLLTKIDKQVNFLKEDVRIIKCKTEKMEWRLTFESLNPWLDMAETERSTKSDLRGKVFKKLGVLKETVSCWVTGLQGDVKVAHILPDSCSNKVFELLKIPVESKNDVEAQRKNILVLNPAFEYAFDHLNLSFVPINPLKPSELCVRIWDDSIKTIPLSVTGRSLTIGDFDGARLNIPSGWDIFKRALSYQTLCAYIYYKNKETCILDESEPADFSSEFEGKDEARKGLASLLQSNIKAELSEEYR
jgi:hypothetical protein